MKLTLCSPIGCHALMLCSFLCVIEDVTHTQPFYDFFRDYPGEPVPEEIRRNLLYFMVQGRHSIRTISDPCPSASIFTLLITKCFCSWTFCLVMISSRGRLWNCLFYVGLVGWVFSLIHVQFFSLVVYITLLLRIFCEFLSVCLANKLMWNLITNAYGMCIVLFCCFLLANISICKLFAMLRGPCH